MKVPNFIRLLSLGIILLSAPGFLGWARAGVTISVDSLTFKPREHSASFFLYFSGDDNHNAEVWATYRLTSASSAYRDSAVVPVRLDAKHFMTGTLFWLQPETGYTVEVRVKDTDNGAGWIFASAAFTTRKFVASTPASQIWVAPTGSDGGPGTEAAPYKTISKALDAVAQGGRINVQPGTYYEHELTTQRGGTAAMYCSIMGLGSPGDVIIDGSDSTGANRVGASPIWTTVGSGDTTYYTTPLPTGSQSGKNVVLGTAERMHRKTMLDQLVHPLTYAADTAYFPYQGYWIEGSYLYVRPETATTTPGSFHIASNNYGLLIVNHPYWHIENITFRYSGDAGLWLRQYYPVGANVAHDIAIRSCRFFDNAGRDLYGELDVDNVLVENCDFSESRIDEWKYEACKGRFAENRTAIIFAGEGWIIRNNIVAGHFDGIKCYGLAVGDNSYAYGDPTLGCNSDVYLNSIDHINDDAIEFDDTNGINLNIWKNTIRHAGSGISHAPLHAGPSYVMYNLIADLDRDGPSLGEGGLFGFGVKWGGRSDLHNTNKGTAYYVHNTFASDSTFYPICNVGGTGADSVWNKILRNNILVGKSRDAVYQRFDSYALDSPNVLPLDYNLHRTSSPATPLTSWGDEVSALSALAQLHSNWGLEAHGVSGDPLFVNPSSGDYHVQAGSPAVNAGAEVRGINTAFHLVNGMKLYDCAPDLGAYEQGCGEGGDSGGGGDGDPILPAGKRGDPSLEFALNSGGVNPSSGTSLLRLSLPTELKVDVRVVDAAGRVVTTLLAGVKLPAGVHAIRWTGTTNSGRAASPGVYYVQAKTTLGTVTRTIVRTD